MSKLIKIKIKSKIKFNLLYPLIYLCYHKINLIQNLNLLLIHNHQPHQLINKYKYIYKNNQKINNV
jgi:hypothetical protein